MECRAQLRPAHDRACLGKMSISTAMLIFYFRGRKSFYQGCTFLGAAVIWVGFHPHNLNTYILYYYVLQDLWHELCCSQAVLGSTEFLKIWHEWKFILMTICSWLADSGKDFCISMIQPPWLQMKMQPWNWKWSLGPMLCLSKNMLWCSHRMKHLVGITTLITVMETSLDFL